MRAYLGPVHCSPGHLKNVQDLQEKINAKVHTNLCQLSLDEMAMRQALCFDPQLDTLIGMCTPVDGYEPSEEDLASGRLVELWPLNVLSFYALDLMVYGDSLLAFGLPTMV